MSVQVHSVLRLATLVCPAVRVVAVPVHSGSRIAIYRSLFRGRTDIFANRWGNQQGRSGYSVACDNEWVKGICNKPRVKCLDCNHRQFSELNNRIIYRHLAGQQVVGLYPLLQDSTCHLLAVDFDKGNCFSFEQNPLDLDEIMQSIVQNEN